MISMNVCRTHDLVRTDFSLYDAYCKSLSIFEQETGCAYWCRNGIQEEMQACCKYLVHRLGAMTDTLTVNSARQLLIAFEILCSST